MIARSLYANAGAAVGQVVVSAVLMFLLYRYLLHQLGPEKLGVWSLVLASGTLTRLADFGLGGSVIKFVASDLGAKNPARAAQTVAMSAAAIGLFMGFICIVTYPLFYFGLKKIITDVNLQPVALALLPWALLSLWVAAIAQVFLGTLDACQKGALRVAINIASSCVQLLACYFIVPRFGLGGLGFVQIAQSLLTMLLALWFVIRIFKLPVSAWFKPDRQRFMESLQYGGSIQIGAIAQLLFDPTVKVLLSHFGGLSSTGYYEAANRAVLQARSLIVSAYQMLVPYLAHRMGEGDFNRDQIANSYSRAHGLILAIIVPYFSILFVVLPSFLTLWIGRVEPVFIVFGLICVVGWALNTFNVSSYMIYVAMGRLRWTMASQLVIGSLCFVLGIIGGHFFGGMGVVGGAMLALVVGSAIVQIRFHVETNIPFGEVLPGRYMGAVVFCLLGAGVLTYFQAQSGYRLLQSAPIVIAMSFYIMVCVVMPMRDSSIQELIKRVWVGRGK